MTESPKRKKHMQARGIERRSLLVQAAYELLCEEDIDDISFLDIAKRAGVPEGSAYHFFKNRMAIFIAVDECLGKEFHECIRGFEPPDGVNSWLSLLEMLIDLCVEIYRKNRAYEQLLLSGKTPQEVRLADQKGTYSLACAFMDKLRSCCDIPDKPELDEKMYFLFEWLETLFKLSYNRHGDVTSEGVAEGKRLAGAYLSLYLPPCLAVKVMS